MAEEHKTEEKTKWDIPQRTFTVEFFVGLFSIIGVGCFAYLAINIARMHFLNTNFYDVFADFDDVSGLEAGAPVEIGGVQIGEVRAKDLSDTKAHVTLQIENNVQLRDDDIATIRTKGIIGDKFVKIIPGGSSEIIRAGGELRETNSAMDFEDIIGKLIHKME